MDRKRYLHLAASGLRMPIGADLVLREKPDAEEILLDELPREDVVRLARELLRRREAAGRPFILGSECDVLSVPGYEEKIRDKVRAFLECPAG